MLTYDLETRGDRPLYEHLYRCVRADIERGKIAAEERLPSKRTFAQHLGVSVITVEGAYRQLVAEGYVRAIEKRGFYVNPVQKMKRVTSSVASADEPAAPVPHANPGLPTLERDDALVDLVTGTPAEGTFPLNAWTSCLRATLAEATERVLRDESYSQGSVRLRRAIVSHLRRFRGIEASPDQIVVGAGAQVLYQLIVQLLGHEGAFALEDPGYTKLARIYEASGVAVRHIEMDEVGISVNALQQSDARIAHVMPSHQFPTGRVMSVGRRYELLGWAAEGEGRLIIEDDYDSEFRLSGRPIPALASIDVESNVIYVNTFAKTLGPALRVGYMVLPEPLANEYVRRLGFYACTVSAIDQFALARFMETGEYERHINRARVHYRKVRDSLIDALKASSIASRLSFNEIDSGIHFVLDVESEHTADQLCEQLREKGVRISAVDDHASSLFRSFLREGGTQLLVNYAGLDQAHIPLVVAALESVVEPEA